MTDKLVWIENHKQHIELLDKLKFKTSYFYIFAGYPFNDGHRDSILEYCCSNLKLIDKIQSKGLFEGKSEETEYYQYIFEIVDYTQRESFFDFLSSFETFFHRECLFNNDESYANRCDFGLDDIAFADKNKNVLCHTITHEAMTYINQKAKL